MKRQLVIIIALFVVALVGAWLYNKTREPGTQTSSPKAQPTPDLDVLRPVPMEPIKNLQSAVLYDFALLPQVSVPKETTLYEALPADAVALARRATKSLGFVQEPRIIKGSSDVYVWENDAMVVTAQTNPAALSIKTKTIKSAGPLAPKEAEAAARSFLLTHGLLGPSLGLQLVSSNQSSLVNEYESVVDRTKRVPVVALVFHYALDSIPLYKTSSGPVGVTAFVDSAGSVVSASISLAPTVLVRQKALLLDQSAVIRAVQNNKSVPIAITEERVTETTVVGVSYKTVSFDSLALAYLWLERERAVRPIYILSGLAGGTNKETAGARIYYFLPATQE